MTTPTERDLNKFLAEFCGVSVSDDPDCGNLYITKGNLMGTAVYWDPLKDPRQLEQVKATCREKVNWWRYHWSNQGGHIYYMPSPRYYNCEITGQDKNSEAKAFALAVWNLEEEGEG